MDKKRIHFMGVGGSGCSAAFALSYNLGFKVTGCDKERGSPYLEKDLKKYVKTGHNPSHVGNVDLLVYSPAIPIFDKENEELKRAKIKGIEAIPWERFVARELLKDKFVIAITGTHGKGTTAAMIAVILEKAGLDPSCLIGALVSDWGKNYRVGKSKYFVVEADEYKERFLSFTPDVAAVTNIDFDHPEYYRDPSEFKNAFEKFARNLKKDSILVVGPGVSLENPNGRTRKPSSLVNFEIKMIGNFNRINASIAAEVARSFSIPEEKIQEALEKFNGISRRFEFKGKERGVTVFDDYAHHPTAVYETLVAARTKFPDKKIWTVFQPHMFTRTKVLFKDFVSTFEKVPVDEVVLVDIFASREKETKEISSMQLAGQVKSKRVRYIPDLEGAAVYLAKEASVGDIVVSMGAGDIYKFPDILFKKLEK